MAAALCPTCQAPVMWVKSPTDDVRYTLDVASVPAVFDGAIVLVHAGGVVWGYTLPALTDRLAVADHVEPDVARQKILAEYDAHLPHSLSCPGK